MSYSKAGVDKSTLLSAQVQGLLDKTHGLNFINLIIDLTPNLEGNETEVRIPRFSGLSLESVVGNTEPTIVSGLVAQRDILELNQHKQVAEIFTELQTIQDAINAEAGFMSLAALRYAEGIQDAIYAELVSANTADFSSHLDPAEIPAGEIAFDIKDIAALKKVMDKAGVKLSERYLVVNADTMEIMASMPEFQDGSKSLSDEALRKGVVSQVKGFQVVQYDGAEISKVANAKKVVAFHKEACAFAWQRNLKYIKEETQRNSSVFVALRGLYGVETLSPNSGKKVTLTAITGTKV